MATYRPDHVGTGRLLRGSEMHTMLIDTCFDEGIPFAKAISPDAPPLTEGYVDSFHVDGGHTQRVAGTNRAVCYLVNDSEHASAVEYGWDTLHGQWTNHSGYHVLAMTADHLAGII
ncbi:MAG TPA: hypothetical protein VFJ19_17385 [Nocardioidaceae bacterium]|nr:hypothetical protein [Nocardioidaceae bacterium]